MQIPIQQIVETIGYITLGAAIAVPLLLLNVKLAPRLGLIDWPKARGLAEDQIPIVGHSLVLISSAMLLVATNLYNISPWVLTTALVMATMGHFDDRKPLSALDKMFFQMVCAATVVLLDPQINEAITVKYGTWGSVLAFVFIIGLINAINFIDGVDGLAGMVVIFGATGFILFSHALPHQYPYYLTACVLIGSFFPFLYLNIVKRRGFLGNVGSYFFSYLLAIMHLSVPLRSESPVSRLALSGLCFLIPLADTAMVISSRILTRRSPFQADKGHLHHRMVQTSIALRYILLNFGLIEMAGLVAAFLLNRTQGVEASYLAPLLCFSYMGIAGVLILLAEKASKRRLQHYFQRMDRTQPVYFMKYQIKRANGKAIEHRTLKRLEARISAEIRVHDLCFAEAPDVLYVSLSTMAEPLKGIAGRFENIFLAEGVDATTVLDHGEFLKVSHKEKASETSHASPTFRKRAV